MALLGIPRNESVGKGPVLGVELGVLRSSKVGAIDNKETCRHRGRHTQHKDGWPGRTLHLRHSVVLGRGRPRALPAMQ